MENCSRYCGAGYCWLCVPTAQSANAETVVIKKYRDHDRDWSRHHHKKVVVIKHRGNRGRDRHDRD